MKSVKPPRLHELSRDEFEREFVTQLNELSEACELNCPVGLSEGPVNKGGYRAIDLKSLADHVYWSWSRGYYAQNAAKEHHMAPSERKQKILDTSARLESFLKTLKENTSDDQEEILTLLANALFCSEGFWDPDDLADLAFQLGGIADGIKTLSAREMKPGKKKKKNRGLHYLVGEIDTFWRTHSIDGKGLSAHFQEDPDPEDNSAKPRTIQTPLNNSSKFCCEIASLIDRDITSNQVRSVMKNIEPPKFARKFIPGTYRKLGRESF